MKDDTIVTLLRNQCQTEEQRIRKTMSDANSAGSLHTSVHKQESTRFIDATEALYRPLMPESIN